MSQYAVIGGTLWGNRGAEAMVVTAFGRVREHDPDASFLLMSYMPQRDRDLCQDRAVQVIDAGPKQVALVHLPFSLLCWVLGLARIRVPDFLLPRPVRALRRCRALLDVTGISFHDGRRAVVVYNIFCLWPALLLKVPVIRLSQAMGPFRHPENRLPARWITSRSMHTFARGRLTADYLRGLKVPDDRWSVAADVAFAYRPEYSITRENDAKVRDVASRLDSCQEDDRSIVAVVPSSLVLKKTTASGDEHGYVDLLRRVVEQLHAQGHHVLLLPNATSAGVDTLRNNDIAVIERLLASLAPGAERDDQRLDQISYVDFDLNTDSIRSLIGRCDAVLTSRFHAMVAALALEVPTLVMGWSHKYEEVLEMFDCAHLAVDFADADDEALGSLLTELIDGRAEIQQRIREHLPDVTASSISQFEQLARLP